MGHARMALRTVHESQSLSSGFTTVTCCLQCGWNHLWHGGHKVTSPARGKITEFRVTAYSEHNEVLQNNM
ncbi:hypothetical protein DPMN_129009 [Dreissena polymorpha]|uniref:Uncharacterized protein n=1 Tax=Dreissena polymorpha TaxID=45954 RepID=A0A9D4H1X7_DREPO|nr:hypothetical protein DPMN_129009 [Dreissena polymorpha]